MAQLAAHLLCKQGVTGSSPVGSTPGQATISFDHHLSRIDEYGSKVQQRSRLIPRIKLLTEAS
jgi:hypothetical protein